MDSQEILSIKQRFGIIGNSPKLNYAIQIAAQVSATDLTVLITGESGSGKESFSKIIHQLSHRKHGSFIAINCGAIPEGTINSELFGHEKGAFTGATDSRKGYFEVTDGGTIFLDEVAELPVETQARLLRVLENKEFIRVGSSKIIKADVRVVAATNVNLLEKVEKGKFREDLYYRLNTVPIYVPPLRERGNDIDLLFRKFTTDFAEKHHLNPLKLSEGAKRVLLDYRFPGNIRQLKNIAEQMSVLEVKREIDTETMHRYLPESKRNNLPAVLQDLNDAGGNFTERELLYKFLFDMRKDVNELRELFVSILQDGKRNVDEKQILRDHAHLFENKGGNYRSSYKREEHKKSEDEYDSREDSDENPKLLELEKFEEIITEDESLSLQDKEREMIIKALKKNNSRRKYAAQDLGISERTLYRKIKQYDINNEDN